MKKNFRLLILFGIFAGFALIPMANIFAQGSSFVNGASGDSCQRIKVKLNENRLWEECGEGEGATEGCRLKFCNSTPKKVEDKLTWEKKACNKYCVGFQEAIPIGKDRVRSISGNSGTDLAMNYVSMIYKFGASILGIIAILVIVVSGTQMIAGGADESNYTDAKDRILQALLSLAILFSSALILRTINPDFFQ